METTAVVEDETAPEIVLYDKPEDIHTQTPIQNRYAFWYHRRGKASASTVNYEESMTTLASFQTVEHFWRIYNHMVRPNDIKTTTDYHIFKDGVSPTWEDPVNKSGGKWMIRVKKGLASRLWEELVLAIIGEQFDVGHEICGAVVSVRHSEDIISIWNKTADNNEATAKIRDQMRRILRIPPFVPIEYKKHQDSLNDKSSFRNPSIVWKPNTRGSPYGGGGRGPNSGSQPGHGYYNQRGGGPGSGSGHGGGAEGEAAQGSASAGNAYPPRSGGGWKSSHGAPPPAHSPMGNPAWNNNNSSAGDGAAALSAPSPVNGPPAWNKREMSGEGGAASSSSSSSSSSFSSAPQSGSSSWGKPREPRDGATSGSHSAGRGGGGGGSSDWSRRQGGGGGGGGPGQHSYGGRGNSGNSGGGHGTANSGGGGGGDHGRETRLSDPPQTGAADAANVWSRKRSDE